MSTSVSAAILGDSADKSRGEDPAIRGRITVDASSGTAEVYLSAESLGSSSTANTFSAFPICTYAIEPADAAVLGHALLAYAAAARAEPKKKIP